MRSATVLALAASGVCFAPAAEAARRKRTRMGDAPTTDMGSGDVSYETSSSSTSKASCSATVSATTTSTAVSSFADIFVELRKTFCNDPTVLTYFGGYAYFDPASDTETALHVKSFDDRISAIAELVLESKIECDASGKYAYACGAGWAAAKSFAGAAYEAYAAAWVDVDTGDCDCGIDIFASSDAVVSSFAEIWTQIAARLDDAACAGTAASGHEVTEVNREKVKSCISTVIFDYWGAAASKAWYDGNCHPNTKIECKTCCVDHYGVAIPDCDCTDWYAYCEDFVYQRALVVAKSWIEGTTVKDEATCTTTLQDRYNGWLRQLHEPFEYENKIDDSKANATAQCEAFTYADSAVSAYNAQANAMANVVEKTCQLDIVDPEPLRHAVDGFAQAHAEIFQEAYAKCSLEGGDAEYDGGCALSTAFTESFAEACSQAIATAVASISNGADGCQCDIDIKALAEATAVEYKTIFAHVQTAVRAGACSYGELESKIARLCVVESSAYAVAHAVANVLIEGKCVSGNKAEFCEGKCVEYETDDEAWKPCVAECEKESEYKAKAIVDTLATIEVENYASCAEYSDPVGDAYSYNTKVNYTDRVDN